MQINFTGIKNIGYEKTYFNHKSFDVLYCNDDKSLQNYDPDGPSYLSEETHFMNVHLTDDYNGKHLTNFKEALRKSGLSYKDFKNPINKDFLNIYIANEVYEENCRKVSDKEFYINNKKVEISDKTLPIFSYIGKIINEISTKAPSDFKVDKDYFESEDAQRALVPDNDMKEMWGDEYYDVLEEDHDPKNVKNGAKNMKELITEAFTKYFN